MGDVVRVWVLASAQGSQVSLHALWVADVFLLLGAAIRGCRVECLAFLACRTSEPRVAVYADNIHPKQWHGGLTDAIGTWAAGSSGIMHSVMVNTSEVEEMLMKDFSQLDGVCGQGLALNPDLQTVDP